MHILTARSTAAAALAGALLLTAAPAAQAGTDISVSTTGAKGYFGAYGETLVAEDTSGDGAYAYTRLAFTNAGPTQYSVTASGSGQRVTKNLSIAEGTTVWIQVCRRTSAGDWLNCSAWTSGTA